MAHKFPVPLFIFRRTYSMVGTVYQKLYIRSVPPGMTMTVIQLTTLPPNPPREWRAILYKDNMEVVCDVSLCADACNANNVMNRERLLL